MIRALTAMLCLGLFVACSGGGSSHEPSAQAECERLGDPCRTPEGPLGVCNETSPCEAPPCLACIPQH